MTLSNCPLCGRELVPGPTLDEHHLIPRTFKGKEKITIHRMCHNKIHSVFTERELQKHFHTIPRILENEEIQTFVKWIAKKPPEFYSSNLQANRRKK